MPRAPRTIVPRLKGRGLGAWHPAGSPTGLGSSRSVVDEAGGEAFEAVCDLLWERGGTAAR